MEHFREELKIELQVTAICCGVLLFFSALGFAAQAGLVELTPIGGDSHWHSMWRGLISGASMGVLALMLFGLVRGIRALKDDKKLKKLYVEANDERQIQIYTSARSASMQITLLAGLVAGLIISYFHMTVGITILAVETIHAFVTFGCKLYYKKKF